MSDVPAVLLLIDSGRRWRGGQKQAGLLLRELAARHNCELHLVAPPGSPLAARAPALGVTLTELRGRHDLDIPAGRKLAAIIRRIKPDIVHCNDSRAHSLAYLARKLGASFRLVVSRRTLRTPGYWAKYRCADRYAAVSRATAGNLRRAGVPEECIDVVYSGIDRPDCGEQPCRPLGPGTRFMVVTVAALEAEKGIDTLVAAAAAPAMQHLPVEWIVVGSGPERNRLERLRQKLRAPVRFVGWQDEVAGFLRGADVVAHPSRSEALGTAIIEALWRGKPVVATNVGGIPELVDDRVGTLVSPDDPEALAGAVATWLRDPSRSRAVAESGPAWAAGFGVDRMVAAMLECYTRVTH